MIEKKYNSNYNSIHIIIVCDMCIKDYVDARTIDESEARSSAKSLGWLERVEKDTILHYCNDCADKLLLKNRKF